MRATLSTSDPYVTINQNFSRYGTIPRNRAVVGIDTFMVQFKTNMPKDHAVWFTLTIEDSLGTIFADGFMIKEGEYLPNVEWGQIFTLYMLVDMKQVMDRLC